MPVSAGYFNAFHIPILSGRGFSASDNLGAQPVAVVSSEFVRDYFPNENPIGKRVRMGANASDLTPWLTIVGVAEEADYFMYRPGHPAAIYMNVAQVPQTDMIYSVITDGSALSIAPEVRKTLAAIDPALPLDSVQTYSKLMLEEKLTGMIYVAAMLGANALIALVLAAIGIFGVMAALVGERTREIGVRLAMGARREDVLRMILRRAMILTGTGLGIGLVMAAALARGVASLLFGVQANDPLVFGSIAAAIAAVALVASWLPARRAAGIDPIIALRDE
jgi:ABC-type antimicrobial peptide transport system permease subunit